MKKNPKSKNPVITPVPAVYRLPEPNPFLRKQKAAILKNLDFRYRSIFRQRDLAICFMALGRDTDALRVLDYAHQNVQFRGSANVWYAAYSACCIASFLRRRKGQVRWAGKNMQRFIDQPAHGIFFQTETWTAAFIRSHLEKERIRFEQWYENPQLEAVVEARAWWIATLIEFRESALLGYPRKGKLNLKRLDSWIEDALAQLRDRFVN